MKAKVLIFSAVGCVMVSGCAFAGDPVRAADIKITFAKPPVASAGELPREVLLPKGSDPDEHGALTNIVAGRIASLTVTWADPQRFKIERQTQDLLRELLSSTNTQTWSYHVWSFGDAQPSLVATVDHIDGKRGRWLLWCSPSPGLYWAYQDGSGKWWWGQWDLSKARKPKSLES